MVDHERGDDVAGHLDVDEPSPLRKILHGTHCDCVLLAAAIGLPPGAVSFEYCVNVLQRRWSMTCKHGEVKDTSILTHAGDRWKDRGEMNPVVAILVKNA